MGSSGRKGGPRPDLFELRSIRLTLFVLIPAVIFALVSAGIRVSQYGIDHTILVLGQERWVAGWPAAIRVVLMSDEGNFFLPERMTGHLVRGDERHLVFDGPVSDRGYALARNFRVPVLSSGPVELELDIRFGEKRRKVRSGITLVDEPPPENLEVPDDTSLEDACKQVEKDETLVQAFTEDRGAPTGLQSVVFIRSVQKQGGTPVATDLSMGLPGPPGDESADKEQSTDRLGLAALSLKPLELSLPIKVVGARYTIEHDGGDDAGVERKQKDAYLYPPVVYSGIGAAIHNPLVAHGDRLRASASQISAGGPIYADVFHRGRWVQAASAWTRGRVATLELVPAMKGLNRIQFTNNAFGPGRTVAVRHFYAMAADQDLTAGLRAVLKRIESSEPHQKWAAAVLSMPLEGGAGYDRRLAAAFSLSRLYAGHQHVGRLVSSRKEDDEELNAFKAKFQRTVMIAILTLGLGVALMIGFMAMSAFRQQQRVTMMIMSEDDLVGDGEGEWQTNLGARGAWGRMWIQGAILFIIIMGAFASIALLIDTMTWNY